MFLSSELFESVLTEELFFTIVVFFCDGSLAHFCEANTVDVVRDKNPCTFSLLMSHVFLITGMIIITVSLPVSLL